MKLIGRAGGIVASREAPEEYLPDRPPPVQDVIALVRDTYEFINFPALQMGININGPFAFAAGRFLVGDHPLAINQLVMLTEGDIVATSSTDDSEMVLEHLMTLLDQHFGFRLQQTKSNRYYASTVIVEFDKPFTDYIATLGKIEQAINGERLFKGVAFGRDDIAEQPATDQIGLIERLDFTIERRTGQPFSSNRFFCTAPMRTRDHIRALETIEAIARGDAD